MPKRSQGINLETPVKVLGTHKEINTIKFIYKDVFKSLGKAASSFLVGKFDLTINNLVDAICSFEVEKDEGQLAWLLINRSIIRAIALMIEENRLIIREATQGFESLANKAELNEENLLEIAEKLDYAVDAKDIAIDDKFFANPRAFSVLEDFKEPLTKWLENFGLNAAQSESICGRFPSYFVFALNDEWRLHSSDYQLIRNKIDTPFTNAAKIEESWTLYNSLLQKRIDEPMFQEAFSLKQIYIPLRGYIEKRKDDGKQDNFERFAEINDKNVTKIVFTLAEELEELLKTSDKSDGLTIISGGPGYGKSSFAKMFAARFAQTNERRVLFIPLHLFKFERDLEDAVNQFIREERILSHNLFGDDNAEERLLIIFDGLDELSSQGKVGNEVAQDFVKEVQRKVTQFNQTEPRLKVIICGRDIAVQASKNDVGRRTQILHLLPYYLSENERNQYRDEKNLLAEDQRNNWWKNYGKATGEGYKEIPEELTKAKLTEITALPLLNYLVALSYTKGTIDFKTEDNLNVVYQDLLESVYERDWDKRQFKPLEGITKDEFIRVLEEVGIAAWHGEGRKVSLKEIEDHCVGSGLKILLDKFQEKAKDGVSSLLLAFYFRKSGNRDLDGNDAFEFTHKSFGEYLTARRIVRGIARINKELKDKQNDYESGWDEVTALVHWVELCGKTAFDEYLMGFVRHEIALVSIEVLTEWQATLSNLINHVLRQGTPMEKLTPEKRLTFKEEMRQARNAEEALLVALCACAMITKEVSPTNFPEDFSLSDWLRRLHSIITTQNLSHLNLQEANLERANLYGANFEQANLVKANFLRTNLYGANLYGANLDRANLYCANLDRANLYCANLGRANLVRANLYCANLVKANLVEANLYRVYLVGANLEQAIWLNGVMIKKKISANKWLLEDGSRLVIGDRTFELIEKESETTDE
jgi:Pentapeptide repeats (8 copies)/ATPase family associated with various cellular activities (AAA)